MFIYLFLPPIILSLSLPPAVILLTLSSINLLCFVSFSFDHIDVIYLVFLLYT